MQTIVRSSLRALLRPLGAVSPALLMFLLLLGSVAAPAHAVKVYDPGDPIQATVTLLQGGRLNGQLHHGNERVQVLVEASDTDHYVDGEEHGYPSNGVSYSWTHSGPGTLSVGPGNTATWIGPEEPCGAVITCTIEDLGELHPPDGEGTRDDPTLVKNVGAVWLSEVIHVDHFAPLNTCNTSTCVPTGSATNPRNGNQTFAIPITSWEYKGATFPFSLTYNSLQAGYDLRQDSPAMWGGLGGPNLRWTHPYQQWLTVYHARDLAYPGEELVVWYRDGKPVVLRGGTTEDGRYRYSGGRTYWAQSSTAQNWPQTTQVGLCSTRTNA